MAEGRRIAQSAMSVLVGYIGMALMVFVGSWLLATAFGLDFDDPPTTGYLALNLVLSLVAAGLGGWIVARLAPHHAMVHVAVLAAVNAAIGLSLIFDERPSGQPGWYGFAVLALGVGGVFAGGAIGERGRAPAAVR